MSLTTDLTPTHRTYHSFQGWQVLVVQVQCLRMGDYKAAFLAVGVLFPILAAVSVLLRFKARRILKQDFGADDWFALAALVCIDHHYCDIEIFMHT